MGKIAGVIRALVGRAAPIRCAHCARTNEASDRFISGPGLYLCGLCAADAASRFAATPPQAVFAACSFCGMDAQAVELGAEHRHAICGDCIEFVEHILANDVYRSRPAT